MSNGHLCIQYIKCTATEKLANTIYNVHSVFKLAKDYYQSLEMNQN